MYTINKFQINIYRWITVLSIIAPLVSMFLQRDKIDINAILLTLRGCIADSKASFALMKAGAGMVLNESKLWLSTMKGVAGTAVAESKASWSAVGRVLEHTFEQLGKQAITKS